MRYLIAILALLAGITIVGCLSGVLFGLPARIVSSLSVAYSERHAANWEEVHLNVYADYFSDDLLVGEFTMVWTQVAHETVQTSIPGGPELPPVVDWEPLWVSGGFGITEQPAQQVIKIAHGVGQLPAGFDAHKDWSYFEVPNVPYEYQMFEQHYLGWPPAAPLLVDQSPITGSCEVDP